jgi:hypothetical protein
MNQISRIAIDTSKSVFTPHGWMTGTDLCFVAT